jgi:hypothetical protein
MCSADSKKRTAAIFRELHLVKVDVAPDSVIQKMEVIRSSETSKYIYHMVQKSKRIPETKHQ